MSDVTPKPVRWLWQNRIAGGRLTLLVGMPGVGKSYLTADMAGHITTGKPWPDGTPCELGSVIMLTAEDDPADTIRPRLDAQGADVSRVHVLTGTFRLDSKDEADSMISLANVDLIESALKKIPDCRLMVIDPIGSFLGGRTDSHRDNEVRSVLAPIAKLAEEYGPAMLAIAHRRKSVGTVADDMALGSRAFTGLARSVWHLSIDPTDTERRLLLPGKNNLAARTSGLAFRILGEPGVMQWEADAVDMTADEALAQEHGSRGQKESAIEKAKGWLLETLASGSKMATDVKDLAHIAGISDRTLDRAAKHLEVLREPAGFGKPWQWSLSDNVSKEPVPPSIPQSRQAETIGNTDEAVSRLD
ncbi:AAA family ATPase [Rosistilla oblonga]